MKQYVVIAKQILPIRSGAQQGEVKVNRDPRLKIYNDSGSDFYLEGEPKRLCTFQSRGPYVVFLEFCISSPAVQLFASVGLGKKFGHLLMRFNSVSNSGEPLRQPPPKPYSIGFALICPIEFSIYTFLFDKHWTNNWQHKSSDKLFTQCWVF